MAVCFDLLAASLVTVEDFPYSLDLAGPVERCTAEVRWRAGLGLAGHLDCSADKSLLPDLDLLTTNFAGSSRLNVWSEGLAELVAVPLSRAYMSRKKPDSAFDGNPRPANTEQRGAVLATAPMMVCWSGLGIVAEVPRVGPGEQRDD